MATEVATSAVEHALVGELARPQRPFHLSVADGARCAGSWGDRDHRYPRRPRHPPLEVVADGCAVEHNDVNHNLRPAAGSPTGWRQLRIGRVRTVCGPRASADRVSNSSYRR